MNCLDVRRLLLADPGSEDRDVHVHVRNCPDCAGFLQGLSAFESDLQQAAKLEVPEGLASRIIFKQQSIALQNYNRRRTLTMVASLMFGLMVLTYHFIAYDPFGIKQDSLDQIALQHVKGELHHLEDRYNLSVHQLNSVLKNHGSKLTALPGRTINYAGSCPIRKNNGVHVVVNGARGPITVLFMTGEFVTQRSELKDQHFKGVIIPTRHGSMAIIGEDPKEIEQLELDLTAHLVDLS